MKKGFTLLETLLVTFIVLIITSISVYSFYALNSSQSLSKEDSNILSLIEEARGQTLASEGSYSYGLHFTSTSTTLFEGETYVAGTSTNKVYALDPATAISTIALTGSTSDVYFSIQSLSQSISH